MKSRTIYIHCDASFSNKHKVGSYGYVIDHPDYSLMSGGVLKMNGLESSNLAELMAIGNALHVLCNNEIPLKTKCRKMVIYSDNKDSIWKIRNGYGTNPGILKRVLKLEKQCAKKFGLQEIKIHHVKSHTGKNDIRSLRNEWCDGEAKRWMQIILEGKSK